LSFFILRTLTDDVAAPTGELSLIPFPSNLLFSDYLSSFDLIIFHNFQYSPFIEKKYLLNIKKYVRDGGSFIMIGGELSFQGGGYKNTAVEKILPVHFDSGGPLIFTDEFRLDLDPRFRNHPILRLEKDEKKNRAAWDSMPPLNGLNAGLIPRKGAQVLGTFKKEGIRYPVLAAGKHGKGRSMVLATDTSWNWNFRRVGEGGSGRYYQKFWNNVIAWLTGDPATHTLMIETDKEKYRAGEKVLIKFRVLREDYNPSPNEDVSLTLRSVSGKRTLLRKPLKTDNNGEGTYGFLPPQEGFYSARIEVERQGRTLTAEAEFGVFTDTAEFQKPMINSQLLRTVAEVTGGVYRVLDENTDLNDLRFPNPKVYVKASSKTVTLWDNWWSFGLILGFLVVDWWIRRKSGLS